MAKLDSRESIKLSVPVAEESECSLVVQVDRSDAVDEGDTGTNAAAGQTFAELGLPSRYQVVELLGEGGMAHVYKAIDTIDGGKGVAIKMLRPEIVPDPSIVERFFREAKASQKLAHPNLVSVFEYGTTDNQIPYLIMEYVDGRNLAQIIADEGHLAGDRSVGIFLQIANGLKDAHRLGVVHRDLKPSNILIATKDDGTDAVKITDFGIAKPASSERSINPDLTKTGAILGSPAYMSPEQCLGHVVDERSDIYSLGCLMYETLTGRSPFASDTPVKSMLRHLEERAEPFEIE
ncbi:MAG TPA: serine/threonine-protein kinase, partial [Trichormus sp.]